MIISSTFHMVMGFCIDSEYFYRSIDNRIYQWTIRSGQLVKVFECKSRGHVLFLYGDSLFAETIDGTIGQWSTKTGQLIHKFVQSSVKYTVAMCAMGQSLFVAHRNCIQQWCINKRKLLRVFEVQRGRSSLDRGVVSADNYWRSYLWRVSEDHCWQSHLRGMVIRGMYLYAVYGNGQIRKWSLFTGQCVKTDQCTTKYVYGTCFNQDSFFINDGNFTWEWSFRRDKFVHRFDRQFAVHYMCASTDRLYVPSRNKIHQWDLRTKQPCQVCDHSFLSTFSLYMYSSYLFFCTSHETAVFCAHCLVCVMYVKPHNTLRWDLNQYVHHESKCQQKTLSELYNTVSRIHDQRQNTGSSKLSDSVKTILNMPRPSLVSVLPRDVAGMVMSYVMD